MIRSTPCPVPVYASMKRPPIFTLLPVALATTLFISCTATPVTEPLSAEGGHSAGAHAKPLPSPDAALASVTGRKTLDADALVTAVLARNPDLEALRYAWQAALERPVQASALDDPKFAYGFAPGTLNQGDPSFAQKIDFSQKLTWPDKRRRRGDAARAEAEAAFQRVEDARRLLARETRALHADWFFVQRALEINAANRELLADMQRLAEEKYATGKTGRQDALQIESESQHLEHEEFSLERERRVFLARINTLLRRDTDAPLPPPPARLDTSSSPGDLADWQRRAVEARPDLRALAREIEARRAGVDLARLDWRPDPTVMATYNSLWAVEEKQGFVGIGFEMPLGADLNAKLRERRALLDESETRFAAAVDRIALEVAEAHESFVENRHIIHLYRDKIVPTAVSSLEAAQAEYAAGKSDVLHLLAAEKNLRIARLGLQKALADSQISRADLQSATSSP